MIHGVHMKNMCFYTWESSNVAALKYWSQYCTPVVSVMHPQSGNTDQLHEPPKDVRSLS